MNEREAGAPDPGPAGAAQPTEEELRAAMEEQMRRVSVQDVILQTVATLVNLSGRRLGLAPDAEDERDLAQARLGIEATRALAPLLGSEQSSAVREALSQLQVAYAREAGAGAAAERPGGEEAGPARGAEAQRPPAPGSDRQRPAPEREEAERARSRIWTPPGS